ncbi:unnamed protein product [Victoria cruziana]
MASPNEYPKLAEIAKQDQPSSLVNDPIEEINIGTLDKPKILQIGSSLSQEEKSNLVSFLTNYREAFAWTYEDMPGLDPNLIQHFLPLTKECKPVKQKLRKLDPRLMGQVKEGLEDLLKAGFIRAIDYPEWLANIVVVPKKNEKIRLCIDFRDLNKATPKDDYPLPNIHLLVDSTAGHAMFSFMDGYSGIAKWQVLLIQYDLEYISHKSIKGQAIADQVADFPLLEELKTDDSFPDETVFNIELPLWTMYFNSSKSTIGAGIRILIVSPEEKMIPFSLKLNFTYTHNMAEYEALTQGLKTLIHFKVSRVHIYGDSMLIINQVNREWQVKDEKLIPYQAIALSLVDKFEVCKISHIKREHNPIADGLASLGSAITFRLGDLIRSFEIGKLEQPAYILALELNLTEETETP